MRSRIRQAVLLTALCLASACDLFGPSTSMEGKYELALSGGVPLPVILAPANSPDPSAKVALVSQVLFLDHGGLATSDRVLSTMRPGTADVLQASRTTGEWSRRGSTIVVRFGVYTETFRIQERGSRLQTISIEVDGPSLSVLYISLYERRD